MGRRKELQTNFSAGELAPELGMRADTEQYQNGAKSLRNRRCLIGGGTSRRPGTRTFGALADAPRLVPWIVNESTKYIIAFSDGAMTAYFPDGTEAGGIDPAPWDEGTYATMDYVQAANTMFVTHPQMATQVITRTGADTWTVEPFAFFVSGPRIEQPYARLTGGTLQPSALTGSVSLVASESVFTANHVGQRIRYLGREMLITAVTDDSHATATVIETLPGTYSLTVASSAGFTVGESVEGATSGAKGVISAIADATHVTVYLRSIQENAITGFDSSSGGGFTRGAETSLTPFGTENLIGPNSTTAISASAAATPAAVADWDEQIIGLAYGYPSCVALHRDRLLFSGLPRLPGVLLGSRLGNLYSFNVDDGSDADAIFETLGDTGAAEIRQIFSAEQLILATDRGLYYCPEGPTVPFRPSSIAFYPFGSPWPISALVKMKSFDNGVLCVSGSLVIKARPTGGQTSLWIADEVSLLSPHLISNPVDMAVTTNFAGGAERYAMFVNDDGSLAVMQLVEAQKIRNFTPWDTDGEFVSLCALSGDVYAATYRGTMTNPYNLEVFDVDLTLDATTEFATQAAMDANAPTIYAGVTPNVVTMAGYSLGTYPFTLLELEDVPDGPYFVGLNFESVIETLPPIIEDGSGARAGDLMRLSETLVYVLESYRFAQNGLELTAYQMSDPLDEPPPIKNGPQRFKNLGWMREPTVTITQPDPLPLTVLAIKTEVTT